MARRRRSQHSSLLLLLPLPLWRAKRICSRCSADSPLTLTPFPCLSTPPPFSRPRQQRQEMLQRRKKEAKSNYKHTPGQSSATGSPLSLHFPSHFHPSSVSLPLSLTGLALLCSLHYMRSPLTHTATAAFIYTLLGEIIDTLSNGATK